MSMKLSRRQLAREVAGRIAKNPQDHSSGMNSLAAYLVHNSRTQDADLLVRDIARELERITDTTSADVITAHSLSPSAKLDIEKFVTELTSSRQVSLNEVEDQDLIGGFKIKTLDSELDASIQTKLQNLAAID